MALSGVEGPFDKLTTPSKAEGPQEYESYFEDFDPKTDKEFGRQPKFCKGLQGGLMSRVYPARPILAAAGLIFRGEEALLARRAKDPGRGAWSIPGGAIRVGETLSEGLMREMSEEVGLEVRVGPLVEVVERVFRDEDGRVKYHYVVLDYLCFAPPLEPNPGSDVSEAKFVPSAEWPAYGLAPLTIAVLEKGQSLARNLKGSSFHA